MRHDALAGAVVRDLPLRHKKDVVEQLVRLRTANGRVCARASTDRAEWFRHDNWLETDRYLKYHN